MIALLLLPLLFPAVLVCADGSPIYVSLLPVEIEVRYVHSVEGYEVREKIRAWRCITLESMEWRGYGAGMPSSVEDVSILSSRRCLGDSLRASLKHMQGGKAYVAGVQIDADELLVEAQPAYRLFLKLLSHAFARRCG